MILNTLLSQHNIAVIMIFNFQTGFQNVQVTLRDSLQLLYRKGVSRVSPEGTKWLDVSLGDEDAEVQAAAAGPAGALWVLTWAGGLMVRTGVSWQNPIGACGRKCVQSFCVSFPCSYVKQDKTQDTRFVCCSAVIVFSVFSENPNNTNAIFQCPQRRTPFQNCLMCMQISVCSSNVLSLDWLVFAGSGWADVEVPDPADNVQHMAVGTDSVWVSSASGKVGEF